MEATIQNRLNICLVDTEEIDNFGNILSKILKKEKRIGFSKLLNAKELALLNEIYSIYPESQVKESVIPKYD